MDKFDIVKIREIIDNIDTSSTAGKLKEFFSENPEIERKDFGKLAGISITGISLYIHGKRLPTKEKAFFIEETIKEYEVKKKED